MRDHLWAVEVACYSKNVRKADAWKPVRMLKAPHLAGALIELRKHTGGLERYRDKGRLRIVRQDDIKIVDFKRSVKSTVPVELTPCPS